MNERPDFVYVLYEDCHGGKYLLREYDGIGLLPSCEETIRYMKLRRIGEMPNEIQ